jgi:hypothetical protein
VDTIVRVTLAVGNNADDIVADYRVANDAAATEAMGLVEFLVRQLWAVHKDATVGLIQCRAGNHTVIVKCGGGAYYAVRDGAKSASSAWCRVRGWSCVSSSN